MPVTSVGDMAQQFISMRAGGTIKSDLMRLSGSLSSGKVADIARHLDGETARFTGINHRLAQLDGFKQVARETSQFLDGLQNVLGRIDTARTQLAGQLLLVSAASTTAQVDEAARTARETFSAMISGLNVRVADHALLGGRDIESTPLISAEEIIADIQAAIGPVRTVEGIKTVIEDWFHDPAGGFTTFGYRGDAGDKLQRQISDDRTITISARADDPAIRQVLKATVLAAITSDLPSIDADTKLALVQSAGTRLFGAASGLVAMQSRTGGTQAILGETQVETTAQETGLRMAINDLVSADPFDTATRLQSVQLQLETHYTIVGRLSQLSLLRFI